MGLQPLEFTDGLTDSPYFRETLQAHERELDLTNTAIKHLIKDIKDLIVAARNLSRAQRTLSETLNNFNFECIGNSQTDDEMVIANSFKDFARLLSTIEDERDRLLEKADEAFLEPIERFRRDQIGSAKEAKKKFEKETSKYCQNLERYLNLSVKKSETQLWEADANNSMEQQHFFKAMSEYVLKLQEVNERKKFEFVETVLSFMLGWLTFYHQGHEIATDFYSVKMELQMRLQRTRNNFNMTQEETKSLRQKMLNNQEKFKQKFQDSCSINKMIQRQGYLFLMEKKAFTTSWTKHFCKYEKCTKRLTMIQYTQTMGKITSTDEITVKECIKRSQDTIDRRFCFDIVTYPDDNHHHHHHHNHKSSSSNAMNSGHNSGNTSHHQNNSSGHLQQSSASGNQGKNSNTSHSPNAPSTSSNSHCNSDCSHASSSNAVIYTFQALSEEDYKHWLDILDAKDAVPPIQSQTNRGKQAWTKSSSSSNSNSNNDNNSKTASSSSSYPDSYNLDSEGYWFVKKCIRSIESKGLDQKGIYRVVGVTSRVRTLMEMFINSKSIHNNNNKQLSNSASEDNAAGGNDLLNMQNLDEVDLLPNFDVESDEFETKTITSALKNYLRHLTEPIMTFKLHNAFISAAKLENRSLRIDRIHQLVHQLPPINFKILKILIEHLQKVAKLHDKNLMTSSNLGVCFGPTLLRTAEESVAAILDIKFVNVIAELLIENYEKFFLSKPSTPISGDDSQDNQKTSANSFMNYVQIQQRPLPNVPGQQPPSQQQQQGYVTGNSVRNISSPMSMMDSYHAMSRMLFPPNNVRRSNSQDQLYTFTTTRNTRAIQHNSNNNSPVSPVTGNTILQHAQHSKQAAQYLMNYSTYQHLQQLATSPTGGTGSSSSASGMVHPAGQFAGQSIYYATPHQHHHQMNKSNQMTQSLYGQIRTTGNSSQAAQMLQPSVSYQNLHHQTDLQQGSTGSGGGASSTTNQSINNCTVNLLPPQYTRPMTSIGIIPPNCNYAPLMIRPTDGAASSSTCNNTTNNSSNSNYMAIKSINFSSSASSASLPSTPEHSTQPLLFSNVPKLSILPVVQSSAPYKQQQQQTSLNAVSNVASGLNRLQIDSQASNDMLNDSLYSTASTTTTAAAASLYGQHGAGLVQNKSPIYGASNIASTTSQQQQRIANMPQTSSTSPHSQHSPLPGTRVRTRYACIGGSDSELSFRPNEVITNVRQSREPGWLEGNLDGKTGLIPQNYVEFLD